MRDFYPKPSRPIATDQGLEAKSRRGAFVANWWAERWIASLEALMDAGRLRRGRRYARQGQVLSLREEGGGVIAEVQGSRGEPYRVAITLEPLTDAQWEQVFDALAQRALFAAQLLAGEMPAEIDTAFASAGAALFPAEADELALSCSCPDWAAVCKHLAACCYLLGERFDEDPFLLFRLRGRDADEVVAALRTRRSQAEADDAEVEEPPAPLRLEDFWEAPAVPTAVGLGPERLPLSLLRRLGPPPFLQEDLLALLAPAYASIARAATEVLLDDPADDPPPEEAT